MPLIKGFQATNVWKAFTLNSIVASFVVIIALVTKDSFDTYVTEKGEKVTRHTSWWSILLTFVIAFTTSMVVYTTMHFTFGYGGGLLTDTN